MAKRKAGSDEEEAEVGYNEESEQQEASTSRAKKVQKLVTKGKQKKSTNSDEEETPLAKPKTVKKPRIKGLEEESSDGTVKTNFEGEKYLELGQKKRVTVRTFKGKVLIDIREFYGDAGDEKPGKKGISLSVEQWKSLTENMEMIEKLVSKAK